MLVTILFADLELAFIFAVLTSLFVGIITENNFILSIILLTNSIIGSILVLGVRRRSQIIRAGFLVGIIETLCFLCATGFKFYHFNGAIKYSNSLISPLVSSIFIVGALPLFEYLFGVITNISLLELSDFNHPLLKRMVVEAPGTYHHSLIVGNLAEAASEIVGANALLSRVGSYYHDIGKIEKAEYFSENQQDRSKHDTLKPSISKIVIMNHVKDGIELAKKFRLNPKIRDFIAEHHGTSLVYYFYRRALEELEMDDKIQEEGYRYPGPKPKSKETAIVLLADSVEAASHALDEPTPAKIQVLVHRIINNKFIDGQLDECELTLKDLENIAHIFVHILGGIYHARVKYPEKDKDIVKESPE
jgi:putative nucleotidyltransferase with HDIG domain